MGKVVVRGAPGYTDFPGRIITLANAVDDRGPLAVVEDELTRLHVVPRKCAVFGKCDRCNNNPGQLVRFHSDDHAEALCFNCWNPLREHVKVIDWIDKYGKLQYVSPARGESWGKS